VVVLYKGTAGVIDQFQAMPIVAQYLIVRNVQVAGTNVSCIGDVNTIITIELYVVVVYIHIRYGINVNTITFIGLQEAAIHMYFITTPKQWRYFLIVIITKQVYGIAITLGYSAMMNPAEVGSPQN
jgi:hypothetical protein